MPLAPTRNPKEGHYFCRRTRQSVFPVGQALGGTEDQAPSDESPKAQGLRLEMTGACLCLIAVSVPQVPKYFRIADLRTPQLSRLCHRDGSIGREREGGTSAVRLLLRQNKIRLVSLRLTVPFVRSHSLIVRGLYCATIDCVWLPMPAVLRPTPGMV